MPFVPTMICTVVSGSIHNLLNVFARDDEEACKISEQLHPDGRARIRYVPDIHSLEESGGQHGFNEWNTRRVQRYSIVSTGGVRGQECQSDARCTGAVHPIFVLYCGILSIRASRAVADGWPIVPSRQRLRQANGVLYGS
jgi:hypothetical protein